MKITPKNSIVVMVENHENDGLPTSSYINFSVPSHSGKIIYELAPDSFVIGFEIFCGNENGYNKKYPITMGSECKKITGIFYPSEVIFKEGKAFVKVRDCEIEGSFRSILDLSSNVSIQEIPDNSPCKSSMYGNGTWGEICKMRGKNQ